jgi:hypothetical protein
MSVGTAFLSQSSILSQQNIGQKLQQLISNALSQKVNAQEANEPETVPATNVVIVKPASQFSIFATCVESVSDNEFKAYFGYENRTDSPIQLTESSVPPGRRIGLAPSFNYEPDPSIHPLNKRIMIPSDIHDAYRHTGGVGTSNW